MSKKKKTTLRKVRKKFSSYTEAALRYASEQAETEHAPKYIKQQCSDFADGLRSGRFPYDDEAVKQACWFMEGLPVPMGEFGKSGRIELAPAQTYWTAELFGRRDPTNELRRQYKEFYLVVPRKAGKSTYGAALCLRELCEKSRRGPLAQCGGRTKEHAWHVYDRAKKMVNASESLRKAFNFKASDRQITRQDASGARMVCESGNLKDGSSPVICTFDELHDCENPHSIEVMRSSFAATREPLLCKFTTAGYLPMSLGLTEREFAIQNFKGTVSLPTHLNLLYEWDEALGEALDDGDIRLWRAIHPMYDHTVEPSFYPDGYEKSKVASDAKAEFDHKMLCKWMRGDQSLVISEAAWDALPTSPPLDRVQMVRAWIGVDSADLHDLTSLTLLGELADGRLCAWWKVLAPRCKLATPDIDTRGNARALLPQVFAAWYAAGDIEACGDHRIDFGRVAEIIADWIRHYPVELVMVDQYSGNDSIFKFLPDAFKPKMVRLRKIASNYTPPTQELLGRVQDLTLAVEKKAVVKWGVCNAVMDNKVSGTLLPKKPTEKSPQKIDPLDSLIQAIAGRQQDEGGRTKLDRKAPIQLRNIGYGGKILVI